MEKGDILKLKASLPRGAIKIIAEKCGITTEAVRQQLSGKNRMSVKVQIELADLATKFSESSKILNDIIKKET